ncbi:D-inositol-3-phosphate glycosyltransferase [compost metagenome]
MVDNTRELHDIRVARVSTVAFFVETQLRSQIFATAQAGARVTVIASESGLSHEIPGTRYLSIEIPRKISLLKDVKALFSLWLLFLREQFQVVHSTTPKAGLLCCIAGKLARVPVRLHTFTGQPWIGMVGIKRLVSKYSDKIIGAFSTHCYADSFSQRDFLVEAKIVGQKKISVLGAGSLAGIDLDRFDPARFSAEDRLVLRETLGIPSSATILLFVGRITEDKGIFELLDAFEHVNNRIGDVYLLLLGPSEISTDDLLDGCSERTQERITLLGFSDEPERYMSIADILVLPSYREGFGTVVIEAAAMGVPTIGSCIYGLSDAVVDGETGVLVPVKDVGELAHAIDWMSKNVPQRLDMGRKARSRVLEEFSSSRLSELLISEYVRLLRVNNECK